MAEAYIGISNVAKKVSDIYVGVNNVAKKVTYGYIGVNNVAKLMYSPSAPSNPLCFTAVESNSSILLQTTSWQGSTITLLSFEYKVNNSAWSPYVLNTTYVSLPNVGDKMYIRATGTNDFSECTSQIHLKFVMSGKIAASGNIMSLIEKTGTTTILSSSYCFSALFSGCDVLTTPPELPATTLSVGCYSSMFYNCTRLTTTPLLPALTVRESSYANMFGDCTLLSTTATMSATSFGKKACSSMYTGCTGLTSLKPIMTTSLSEQSLQYMFFGCTSLNALPKLDATVLPKQVYSGMFLNCSNIKLYSSSGAGHTNAYKIPFSNVSTSSGDNPLLSMFTGTGGDITNALVDVTYYTSNQVV